MRKFILLIILSLVLSGCISDPPEVNSPTEKGDIKVISLETLNDSYIVLGDTFKIKTNIESTSDNATYVLRIKLGDETIYSEELKGNQSIERSVSSLTNGKLNLTANIYSKDLSKFVDLNTSNDEFILPLIIHSYGRYDFNSSTTNYSIISNEKVHSTKISFDSPVYVNSIGTFVRVTAPLNVDSYLIYDLVKDINGTPSNESVFSLQLQIYKLSYNWEFLLLQQPKKYIEKGDYWLNIYTTEKNFLNLACYEDSEKLSLMGTKFSGETKWKETNCTSYFIISNAPLIETYEDFNNRFSIFNSIESNSS